MHLNFEQSSVGELSAYLGTMTFLLIVIFALKKIMQQKRIILDLRRQDAAVMKTFSANEALISLGRNTLTFAHEINNSLEAAVTLLYLLNTSPELPKDLKHLCATVDVQLRQTVEVCKATLQFHKQHAPPVEVNVREIVEQVIRDKQELLDIQKKRIAFLITPPTRRILQHAKWEEVVEGYPVELQQVVLNLVNNSIDAIREKTGCISVWIDGSADTVALVIHDNGVGLPIEMQANLGKVLGQTTKANGNGLGLALVKRVVERHSGTISVISKRQTVYNKGFTQITIRLPKKFQYKTKEQEHQGKGKILV